MFIFVNLNWNVCRIRIGLIQKFKFAKKALFVWFLSQLAPAFLFSFPTVFSSESVSANSNCISEGYSFKNSTLASLMWLGKLFVGMPWSFWWWISTLGGSPSRIHWCRMASSGLIRLVGSHSRHLSMKFTKDWSDEPRTSSRILVPGLRTLPLELGPTYLGIFLSSKNLVFLYDCFSTSGEGMPQISMIKLNWSVSSSPGNIG